MESLLVCVKGEMCSSVCIAQKSDHGRVSQYENRRIPQRRRQRGPFDQVVEMYIFEHRSAQIAALAHRNQRRVPKGEIKF